MSHLDVMSSGLMFGVVISQISGPWFPKNIKVFLDNFILYPMKTHIHSLGAFLFDALVGYFHYGGILLGWVAGDDSFLSMLF